MMDQEVLKELGVTTMGHALAILKLAKKAAMLGESFDFYRHDTKQSDGEAPVMLEL